MAGVNGKRAFYGTTFPFSETENTYLIDYPGFGISGSGQISRFSEKSGLEMTKMG
jgi:hypothetical protein